MIRAARVRLDREMTTHARRQIINEIEGIEVQKEKWLLDHHDLGGDLPLAGPPRPLPAGAKPATTLEQTVADLRQKIRGDETLRDARGTTVGERIKISRQLIQNRELLAKKEQELAASVVKPGGHPAPPPRRKRNGELSFNDLTLVGIHEVAWVIDNLLSAPEPATSTLWITPTPAATSTSTLYITHQSTSTVFPTPTPLPPPPAPTPVGTPHPEFECIMWRGGKTGYDQDNFYIRNVHDEDIDPHKLHDFSDRLHYELNGCMYHRNPIPCWKEGIDAQTGRKFYSFSMAISYRGGCVERAMRSAGGPRMQCFDSGRRGSKELFPDMASAGVMPVSAYTAAAGFQGTIDTGADGFGGHRSDWVLKENH